MIIKGTGFDYNSPGEAIAGVKNDIIDAMWELVKVNFFAKHADADDPSKRAAYYRFNQRISDIVDTYISTLDVTYSHDRLSFIQEYEGRVLHQMSAQLAEAIFKSDFVSVYKTDTVYCPEIKYQCSIPFVKAGPKRPI